MILYRFNRKNYLLNSYYEDGIIGAKVEVPLLIGNIFSAKDLLKDAIKYNEKPIDFNISIGEKVTPLNINGLDSEKINRFIGAKTRGVINTEKIRSASCYDLITNIFGINKYISKIDLFGKSIDKNYLLISGNINYYSCEDGKYNEKPEFNIKCVDKNLLPFIKVKDYTLQKPVLIEFTDKEKTPRINDKLKEYNTSFTVTLSSDK